MKPILAVVLLLGIGAYDPARSEITAYGLRPTAHGSQHPGPPQYRASYFDCAAFLEDVRTSVAARRGMESWQERGRRGGRMVVNAISASDPIGFEAWYDSLSVFYDGRAGPVRPDTDGLVGGRWRGSIAGHGAVELAERPFIPPDLKLVSDLSDQMLDFFPPLPTLALAVRGSWTDSLGLEIERLSDSTTGDVTLERYRWRIHSQGNPTPLGADTVVRLQQNISDEGVVAWSRSRGPLGWRREIVVDAALGSARARESPVQSRVTQSVTVRRVTGTQACH